MRIFCVLMVVLLSTSAMAQDTPYSPRAADYSTLLKPASYGESPLTLKYPLIGSRQVVQGPRLDFEHVYDVPYDTFVKEMMAAYKAQKVVSVMRADVIPHLGAREIFIQGVNYTGDNTLRLNLGIKDVALRFTMDIVPDQNHTVVVIHNAFASELYSGVMPARAGYKPKNAQSVSFRWN